MKDKITTTSTKIRVIDVCLLETKPDDFLYVLREAIHEVGFAYIFWRGLPQTLIDRAQRAARTFFTLPEAEKWLIAMVNAATFRDYDAAGLERTRGKPDRREQIDIGAEDPAQSVDRNASPWKRLIGPNQWPKSMPELKSAILEYQAAAAALGVKLLRTLSLSSGQDADAFAPIYMPQPHLLTKIICYSGRDTADGDQALARTRTADSSPGFCRTKSQGCRRSARTAGLTQRHPLAPWC